MAAAGNQSMQEYAQTMRAPFWQQACETPAHAYLRCRRVRTEFDRLVATGMTQNEAAVAVLRFASTQGAGQAASTGKFLISFQNPPQSARVLPSQMPMATLCYQVPQARPKVKIHRSMMVLLTIQALRPLQLSRVLLPRTVLRKVPPENHQRALQSSHRRNFARQLRQQALVCKMSRSGLPLHQQHSL